MTDDISVLEDQLAEGVMEPETEVQTHYSDVSPSWPDLSQKTKFSELPPAPISSLPTVIQNMCRAVSEVGKVPIEVPMLNAMAIVGFCAGAFYRASFKKDFRVSTNIYGLTFQGPGERKSSTYSPLIRPVKDWISSQQDNWRDEQTSEQIRQGKIKHLMHQIQSNKTENEAADRNEIRKLENEQAPPDPNFILGEGTGGAMADRMSRCGGRLFYTSADAKDALEIMMGKYTDGKTDTGLMLQSFDGETYSSARRNQENNVLIEAPFMGICLLTQINQLQNIANKSELFESGLMSRFITCFPDALAGKSDKDGNLIRPLTDEEIPQDVEDQYKALIGRLLRDSSHVKQPYEVPIDSDARQLFSDFYEKCERKLGSEYEDCQNVAIRLPVHAFKFALVISICREDTNPAIVEQDMKHGIDLAEYYWNHTERALGMMSKRRLPEVPRRIVGSIRKHGDRFLESRKIQQRLNGLKSDQIQDGIKWLLDKGYCREVEEVEEGKTRGRPRNGVYEVNPTILED
jgi:hypothetical protein